MRYPQIELTDSTAKLERWLNALPLMGWLVSLRLGCTTEVQMFGWFSAAAFRASRKSRTLDMASSVRSSMTLIAT